MSNRRAKGSRVRFERVPVPADTSSATSHTPVVVDSLVGVVERPAAMTTGPDGTPYVRLPDQPTEVLPVVEEPQEEPAEEESEPVYVDPPPCNWEYDAETPTFDSLADSPPFAHLAAEAAEWDRVIAEPFEDWGLDAIAPPPLVTLIEALTDRVGAHRAFEIEQGVGAETMAKRLVSAYEELEGRGDSGDGGRAGDAAGADAGGAVLVDEHGGPGPGTQGAR